MAFLTRFSGFPGVSGVGFIRCRWAVYMSCDCACQVQAQMAYNGLAYKSGLRQRMTMTAYSSGLSVTTQYTPDPTVRSRTLAATADGQTSFYLYGLGPLGEFTNVWSYSLPDGTGTPRQLTDAAGGVTLANRYDPWGEMRHCVRQQAGQGNFTWGYFGGLMDAATGLIYVGDGQYYDPQTGRFLTRGAQQGKANPYVPWGGDPTGLLVGPLALMVLLRWKKRGRALSRMERVLLAVLVLAAVGVAVAGCGGGDGISGGTGTPTDTPTPRPDPTSTPIPPTSQPSDTPYPSTSFTETPTPSASCYQPAPLTEEMWADIARVVYYEGASSFKDPQQRNRVFERQLWALRSIHVRQQPDNSYDKMVQTCGFMSACEVYGSNKYGSPQISGGKMK